MPTSSILDVAYRRNRPYLQTLRLANHHTHICHVCGVKTHTHTRRSSFTTTKGTPSSQTHSPLCTTVTMYAPMTGRVYIKRELRHPIFSASIVHCNTPTCLHTHKIHQESGSKRELMHRIDSNNYWGLCQECDKYDTIPGRDAV